MYLSLGSTAMWGRMALCGGDCPVHYSRSSNILSIYPLDANNTLRVATNKNASQYCLISRGLKSPPVEISASDQRFSTLTAQWNHLESFRNNCQYFAPSQTKQTRLCVCTWGLDTDLFFSVPGILVGLRIEKLCLPGSKLHEGGVVVSRT